MSVGAISLLTNFGIRKAAYRAPEMHFAPQAGLKNTFAGNVNLNAPQHADVCNARKYLGDDVPGSKLCLMA